MTHLQEREKIHSLGEDKESETWNRSKIKDRTQGLGHEPVWRGAKDPEKGSGSEPQALWREMIQGSGGSWRRFRVRNWIQCEKDSVSHHQSGLSSSHKCLAH